MITKVFAVFDSKVSIFGQPFFDHNDGSAIRNFSDAVNDGSNPNNMWHKHPEDFSLFVLGNYDNETGELIPLLPRSLITASAIKMLDYNDSSNAIKIHDKNGASSEKQISDGLRLLSDPKGLKSA